MDAIAQEIVEGFYRKGLTLALAESCTGGLIAASITAVAGASRMFQYGWVTYSARAKSTELGLSESFLAQHDIVSEPIACEMARAALQKSGADYALSVTGNAGPTAELGAAPVGTVCLAIAHAQKTESWTLHFSALERCAWRERVVQEALLLLQSSSLYL